MYVANVGDSRAVLGRRCVKQNGEVYYKAVSLSEDQKPDRADESDRIKQSGGRIYEWGVQRVWLKEVDMPGLGMTRSFGSQPEQTLYKLLMKDGSQVTKRQAQSA